MLLITYPHGADQRPLEARDEGGGPNFTLELLPRGEGAAELVLSGDLLSRDATPFWNELRRQIGAAGELRSLDVDLSGVHAVDGGTMALLVQFTGELHARGVGGEIRGAAGQVADILGLYKEPDKADLQAAPKTEGTLSHIGRGTLAFIAEVKEVLSFLGTLALAIFGVIWRPQSMNWRGVLPIIERAGADAIPIILLINFLLGFVMGFQGAIQLKQFGANIYVADLVGLSVTRELGPLMAAIIVCGRSGAAFAAELGTMKVSEEIDALRTMGFGPMRYLVMPRTLGLMIVLPVLTLIADAIALFGGLLVGIFSLDLTPMAYLLETQKAVTLWDVCSGLLKSVVFAFAIGMIACQQGLATSGGAEGVGRRTTSSVVAILFALILIDAGFTVLFVAFDL